MAEPEFNPDNGDAGSPLSLAPADFVNDERVSFDEESGKWTYKDGQEVRYEFDEERKAWFPMWNQELVETQQSAYAGAEIPFDFAQNGIVKQSKPSNAKRKAEAAPGGGGGKKAKQQVTPPPVTSVYVTGLPEDATVVEIAEVFSKFGIIMEDLVTGRLKVKIYTDAAGQPKGDGLVSYLKAESVPLACELLDETEFRPGSGTKIRVQKAEFKEKAGTPKKNNATSAQERKKLQKRKQQLEKKLEWFDADEKSNSERFRKIVVLKHMFTQKELEDDVTLILDLKEDIRTECERLGEVTNIILYDKTEDGVVSVRFKDAVSAEACVKLMNGRFFGGRRVSAEIYDGKTKYEKSGGKTREEDEAEEKARLERYAEWLEQQEREEREGREGVGQSGTVDDEESETM